MFWLRNKKIKFPLRSLNKSPACPPPDKINGISMQGFSSLSEVWGQGPVEFGKKTLDYQNWENFMQSKRTGLPF